MRILDFSRCALSICAAAAFLAGCGGSQLPIGPPGAISQSSAIATQADRGPFLYVGSHKLSKYALGSSEPLRTIEIDNSVDRPALAIDAHANLFEANGNPSYSRLLIYDARSLKLLRAVDIGWIASLVVDRSDDLYAANGAGIWVFAPGAKRLIYTIRRGAGSAQALAFDRSGNLFAANIQARSVSVYAPTKRSGHMKWIREIHDGIDNPDALAFAPSGDLFVANLLPGNGFISVYPPGGSKPERRITSGVNSPWQLTVDSKGRLYVGNVPPNGPPHRRWRGWVSVYAPGDTQPIGEITVGIYTPLSLAIGPSDDLYVGNAHYGDQKGHVTVTVYTPGGAKLLRTITEGINGGLALLIGSS